MMEALIEKLLSTPPHEEIDVFREMSDAERDYVRMLVVDLEEATDLQEQELEELPVLKRYAQLVLWGEDPHRLADWVAVNPVLGLETTPVQFAYWLRERTRGVSQRVFLAPPDEGGTEMKKYTLQPPVMGRRTTAGVVIHYLIMSYRRTDSDVDPEDTSEVGIRFRMRYIVGTTSLVIEQVAMPFVEYLGDLLLGIALDFPEACEPLGLDMPKPPKAGPAYAEPPEDSEPEELQQDEPAEETRIVEESKPWMQIPERKWWYRKAVELWWEGHTYPEIGSALGLRPHTIQNDFAIPRQLYPELVPTDDQRRQMRLK